MTNSTTHFVQDNFIDIIIYRHGDGYPDVAGVDIRRFLHEVDENLEYKRFDDPEYLAAKYVVWLSRRYQDGDDAHYLDFIGVGVCSYDPGDIEYRYTVHCDETEDGPPRISCERIGDGPVEIPNLPSLG